MDYKELRELARRYSDAMHDLLSRKLGTEYRNAHADAVIWEGIADSLIGVAASDYPEIALELTVDRWKSTIASEYERGEIVAAQIEEELA